MKIIEYSAKLLPTGLNANQEEQDPVDEYLSRLSWWIQQSNQRLVDMMDYDVYKALLRVNGGPSSNRLTLEKAFQKAIEAKQGAMQTVPNDEPPLLPGDVLPQMSHKK